MIPDEAIEAAAMAILGVTPDVWELQTTGTKDRYRWDAQVALEAAAQHIRFEPKLCVTCGGGGLADPEEIDMVAECPTCKGSGLAYGAPRG